VQVLLIEDDPLVRASIAKILERGGFTVLPVANGLTALSELRDRRFTAMSCEFSPPSGGYPVAARWPRRTAGGAPTWASNAAVSTRPFRFTWTQMR